MKTYATYTSDGKQTTRNPMPDSLPVASSGNESQIGYETVANPQKSANKHCWTMFVEPVVEGSVQETPRPRISVSSASVHGSILAT